MRNSAILVFFIAVVAVVGLSTAAGAHAMLDHASPAVGSIVGSSPGQVTLYFTSAVSGKLGSPRIQGSEPTLANCYRVLRRFSVLAAWSVALLAGSGALNTWFMTNGLRNFLGTEYGDLVLIKIVLFVVLLSFGAATGSRLNCSPSARPRERTAGHCGCSAPRLLLKSP